MMHMPTTSSGFTPPIPRDGKNSVIWALLDSYYLQVSRRKRLLIQKTPLTPPDSCSFLLALLEQVRYRRHLLLRWIRWVRNVLPALEVSQKVRLRSFFTLPFCSSTLTRPSSLPSPFLFRPSSRYPSLSKNNIYLLPTALARLLVFKRVFPRAWTAPRLGPLIPLGVFFCTSFSPLTPSFESFF